MNIEVLSVFLSILAASLNSLWTALTKITTKDLPSFESAILFRTLSLIFLFPVFLYYKISPSSNIFYLYTLLAGIFEIILLYVLFKGFSTDYYTTYGLFNTSPIFILIFSPFIFGEKVGHLSIFGVIIIVLGAIIFLFIGKKNYIYGILSSITVSLSAILSKKAMLYLDNMYGYSFLLFLFGVVFLFIFRPKTIKVLYIKRKKISLFKFIVPVFISFIATMSWYTALAKGNTIIVFTVFRISLVFGIVYSYFILKEKSFVKYKLIAGILVMMGTMLTFIGR